MVFFSAMRSVTFDNSSVVDGDTVAETSTDGDNEELILEEYDGELVMDESALHDGVIDHEVVSVRVPLNDDVADTDREKSDVAVGEDDGVLENVSSVLDAETEAEASSVGVALEDVNVASVEILGLAV